MNEKIGSLAGMKQTGPGASRRLVEQAREAERRGDTARSLSLYDDAIEVLEREQDWAALADALRWKGTLHREQGETDGKGCALVHGGDRLGTLLPRRACRQPPPSVGYPSVDRGPVSSAFLWARAN